MSTPGLTAAERRQVRTLYVDQKLSLRKTAAIVGRSLKTVHNYLKGRGLTRSVRSAIRLHHHGGLAAIEQGVHLYHVVGLTLALAAEQAGMQQSTLSDELKRRRLMRTRSEDMVRMHARRARRLSLWERRARVFDLYTVGRLTYAQIAERLGLSRSTVQVDLKRYRSRFGADQRQPGRQPLTLVRAGRPLAA